MTTYLENIDEMMTMAYLHNVFFIPQMWNKCFPHLNS